MKQLLVALIMIPGFVLGQNQGIYINANGKVAVGTDTVWQPFQVFVDTGLTEVLLDQAMNMGNTSGVLITPSVSDGQSFVCGLNGELVKMSLRLSTDSPQTNSTIELQLRTGNLPTGPVVASKLISVDGGTLAWYEVEFSPGILVNQGDAFFIELGHSSGDNGVWDWADSSNPYPSGSSWQNGGSWTEIANSDLAFKSYVRTAVRGEAFSITSDAKVRINDYTLPRLDGVTDQVISTDGTGSASWKNVSDIFSAGSISKIEDADSDTKVQVEKFANENVIRFNVEGTEIASLDSATFHLNSPGQSLFIGKNAGINDDGSNNGNTYIGFEAGMSTTAGYWNTSLGYGAMRDNTTGDANTSVGNLALRHNGNGHYNSAYGYGALNQNTDGHWNTALGYIALGANTTGVNNTAIGSGALRFDTTGSYNTAIGTDALNNNQTGSSNVAVGAYALNKSKTQSGLVAIGDSALYKNGMGATLSSQSRRNTAVGSISMRHNTTGNQNTAIGYESLYSNTTGIDNTATGASALFSNTIGDYNTATGYAALYYNVDGEKNTATGFDAILNNSSGDNNTGNGFNALKLNSTGNQNTATGAEALANNTQGERNTAVGYIALNDNTMGDNNTAVGIYSLEFNNLGGNNTALGYSAHSNSGDYTNSMGLGYDADPTASNRVHIGNSSIAWIGGQVNWSTYSDGRFKSNVRESIAGLDFIKKLRPVSYNVDFDAIQDWRAEHYSVRDSSQYAEKYEIESYRFSGFIAQEVEQAADESEYDFSGICTPDSEKDFYSLRYAEFVVPLVKAVQELSEMNQELLERIESLEIQLADKSTAGIK